MRKGRRHRRQHPQGFDQQDSLRGRWRSSPREARLRYGADRRPSALQPGRRGEPDAGGHAHQGADQGGGRRPLRDAGAQPLHPGRAQERHRLGVAAAEGQRVRGQGRRDHRHVARPDLDGRRAEPSPDHRRLPARCGAGVPEAYINFTDTLIDVDANVTDESGEEVLSGSSTACSLIDGDGGGCRLEAQRILRCSLVRHD